MSASLIYDAVKVALHSASFDFDASPGISMDVGLRGVYTPDRTDADYAAITGAGWAPTDTQALVTLSVTNVSGQIMWDAGDPTFSVTANDALDTIVLYEPSSGLLIAYYDLGPQIAAGVNFDAAINGSGLILW